jgi:SAM-dependent methyltransferase
VANFLPLKRGMLFCLDQLIDAHGARPPFLDVGCGIGDVSLHLAETRGWHGRAIDVSETAIPRARHLLAGQPGVTVEHQSLDQEGATYRTIVMMDVLEHLDEDRAALREVAARLVPGGLVFLTVPSNPREWRWDDVVYGHVRRYRASDLAEKLREAKLEPVVAIDVTYPVFWMMRRVYTRLLHQPSADAASPWQRTMASTGVNAWHVPVLGALLSRGDWLWRQIFRLQYRYCRRRVDDGHELMMAARKPDRVAMAE